MKVCDPGLFFMVRFKLLIKSLYYNSIQIFYFS